MPLYEYECQECGSHIEVLQKMSDAPLKKCANCKKQKLKRLISVGSFRINGKGVHKPTSKMD